MKPALMPHIAAVLIVACLAFPCFASDSLYTVQVGEFNVTMLPEVESEWDLELLVGVSDAQRKALHAQGKYAFAISTYLVQTPDRTILIDAGVGRVLRSNLAKVNVKPEDVDTLLLTHSHSDHVGGLVRGGRPVFPNAVLYANEREAAWSESLQENLHFYKGRYRPFLPKTLIEGGSELFPGVRAIAAYGHTPGHTLFLIESNGQQLLLWGDLTHATGVQMPSPDVSVTYDDDPVEAAKTRREVLKYVSERDLLVAGMLVPFPGFGKVRAVDPEKEIYRFDPVR